MNKVVPKTSSLVTLALALTMTFSLCGCFQANKAEKKSIEAKINIPVKDPLLKRLSTAAEQVELEATGEFQPGTYDIHGTKLTITAGTKFRLSLKLPIKDPDFISTALADGKLDTTQPLQAKGISLPQSIVLSQGKVSGDVDLVRTLGSFFINLLQIPAFNQSEGGEASAMLASMHIESAKISLRPDAVIKLGKSNLHVSSQSFVQLMDVSVDKNLDYQGICLIKLNFASGSAYIGEKVDTCFNGGAVNDSVSVQRKSGFFTLSPLPKHLPKVTLKDCTFKFGREKTSQAHSDVALINVDEFHWTDNQRDALPADYHFDAHMGVTDTHMVLNYPSYSVDAIFPETEPTTLKIYRQGENNKGVDFATHEVMARTADIKIKRGETTIDLQLEKANLGSISFTKSGDFNFNLSESTSGLRAFEWSNGKKKFGLKTEGGSTISITKGLAMALNRDHPGAKVTGTIPLSVKLGAAAVSNTKGTILDLSKLSGKIVIDMDHDVELNGAADFSIAQCPVLGDIPADVKVKGFKLTSGTDAAMNLSGCSVVVPKGTIAAMIKKQIPDEKSFDLNQEIFEDKKWRYKHGMITKLIVRKPVVNSLVLVGPGKATFDLTGDVEVDGTIDKTGILGAFKKDAKKWETKPWSASSACTGSGSVTLTLVPNKSLAESAMKYSLNLQLPLPQDIDIDWHEVSGGLVRKAETSVISSYLNKCEPFHGGRTIPLDHAGSLRIFDAKNTKLQSVRITKFALKPTANGTEIDFEGEALL